MNIAIVLAGGVGSRINSDIPKQFVKLSGKMMITHSLIPFGESEMVDNIRIVTSPDWIEKIEDDIFENKLSAVDEKLLGFSEPGSNRQLSIYNALKDIRGLLGPYDDGDINVIIHDAARPFVTVENIEECLGALSQYDGAMPVLPMSDTVYLSRNGKRVDELLDRGSIFAGQAPEAFRFEGYLAANEALLPERILSVKGSTEPAILAGLDVAMIPGDQRNFKVTTDEDLKRAKEILEKNNNEEE